MKKSILALSWLIALGAAPLASAQGPACPAAPGVQASLSLALPGMRLVFGRPGTYCWYQGRYYNRSAWERFYRYRHDRFAYYRHGRDNDRSYRDFDRSYRSFDRDRSGRDLDRDHRGFDRDGDRF